MKGERKFLDVKFEIEFIVIFSTEDIQQIYDNRRIVKHVLTKISEVQIRLHVSRSKKRKNVVDLTKLFRKYMTKIKVMFSISRKNMFCNLEHGGKVKVQDPDR